MRPSWTNALEPCECTVPFTPYDPSVAFVRVVDRILADGRVPPDAVELAVHGTTVATNAIIQGRIARIGFLTTDGFPDMLKIARQIRPVLYDLQFEKPAPLVPRYLSFVCASGSTRTAAHCWRSARETCAEPPRSCVPSASRRSPSAFCTHTGIRCTSGALLLFWRNSCQTCHFPSRRASRPSFESTPAPAQR